MKRTFINILAEEGPIHTAEMEPGFVAKWDFGYIAISLCGVGGVSLTSQSRLTTDVCQICESKWKEIVRVEHCAARLIGEPV